MIFSTLNIKIQQEKDQGWYTRDRDSSKKTEAICLVDIS